jgi:hypothetical protein
MKADLYIRVVLTVIATALVYLCVIFTALPVALAQQPQVIGAATPGVSTGPGEMVIVGWRTTDTIPVAISRGEVRVTGRVETQPAADAVFRTALIGWEERAVPPNPGTFHPFVDAQGQALPVAVTPRTP